MRLTRLAPYSDFEQQHRWNMAATSTAQADPFCCGPIWQLSFHEIFGPERRLLLEESAGNRISFAEQVFASQEVYLTPIEPHWFFGCPLLGNHAVDLLAEAVAALAEVYKPVFPSIIISGIRPGSALASRLLRIFGNSFNVFLYSKGMQGRASLEGGLDGFLSRRSANHRSKLKKDFKRAANKGIYFERVAPICAEEAHAAFLRMIAIERKSWKGIGQCGMAEPPASLFYEVMMKRLAIAKAGKIIFARHEDADIGFIFGGMAGSVYRGQQFSYDNSWRDFAVGNMMQVEKVKWLCEEGTERYDMGPLDGPRMDYKRHWTEEEVNIETWLFERGR